jgi:hypothetical protein
MLLPLKVTPTVPNWDIGTEEPGDVWLIGIWVDKVGKHPDASDIA